MTTRIEKCLGGLSVVVPESMANEVGLFEGSNAEVRVTNGRLIVGPAELTTLDDLLARITPDNLHEEWAAGPPVGKEIL
jgi:antitoxin MazE